jgi:hypothetical protein
VRALLAVGLVLAGCSYPSHYVPPLDGRARVLWEGDNVGVHLGGEPVTDGCLDRLRAWSGEKLLRLVAAYIPATRTAPAIDLHGDPAARIGWWDPVYYGEGLAPGMIALHPVLFSPSLALVAPVPLAGPGIAGVPPLFPVPIAQPRADIALFVAALAVMPVIAVLMASTPPETNRSSDAIDQVNVFNDLARTPGTPCSYVW